MIDERVLSFRNRLTARQGLALRLLVEREFVSRDTFMDMLYSSHDNPPDDTAIDQLMWRLRRKLGVEIRVQYGIGWYMSFADRQRFRQSWQSSQVEATVRGTNQGE